MYFRKQFEARRVFHLTKWSRWLHRVTTVPIDEISFSPAFIQQRNICNARQQLPGRKLNTAWHRRTYVRHKWAGNAARQVINQQSVKATASNKTVTHRSH